MSKPYPWPKGKTACITLTMDNMGEAADLHRGIWPSTSPIGSHHSVTTALPTLLSIFATHDIPITYFIEAWNMTHYTTTIRSLSSSPAVEIGFHAYQHEVWKSLDAETEVRNLERSVADAGKLGVRYAGFRPPGGLITPRTLGLMKKHNFTYLSPAATRPAVVEGVAMLPFQWRDIDAYFYLDSTAPLRVANGDGEEQMEAEVLLERVKDRIDETIRDGGYLSLLFHPFLQTDEGRMVVVREVVEYLAQKRDGDGLWLAKCEEVADWVLEQGEEVFGSDPGWDTAEWKKK